MPGRVWSVCEANSLNIEMSCWGKFKPLKKGFEGGWCLFPRNGQKMGCLGNIPTGKKKWELEWV